MLNVQRCPRTEAPDFRASRSMSPTQPRSLRGTRHQSMAMMLHTETPASPTAVARRPAQCARAATCVRTPRDVHGTSELGRERQGTRNDRGHFERHQRSPARPPLGGRTSCGRSSGAAATGMTRIALPDKMRQGGERASVGDKFWHPPSCSSSEASRETNQSGIKYNAAPPIW